MFQKRFGLKAQANEVRIEIMASVACNEPLVRLPRPKGMSDAIHEMLRPIVRSFIERWAFSLAHKAANWLDAIIPSLTARILIGFVLGFATIASIVVVTAMSGY